MRTLSNEEQELVYEATELAIRKMVKTIIQHCETFSTSDDVDCTPMKIMGMVHKGINYTKPEAVRIFAMLLAESAKDLGAVEKFKAIMLKLADVELGLSDENN